MPPLCLRCAHSPCSCNRPIVPAPGSSDLDILAQPGHGMIIGPDDALFREDQEGVPPPGARYDPPGPFGIEPLPDDLMPPSHQGDSDPLQNPFPGPRRFKGFGHGPSEKGPGGFMPPFNK
jgi:hypothetical protein